MARFQALCVSLFVVALLAPSAAWSQETPAAADPVADALATVKSVASIPVGDFMAVGRLATARARTLADQRQRALPQIALLLNNSDELVRMNAAMIFNDIARAGDTSPAVIQGLQKALKDASAGVTYWGFLGMLNDGVPPAEKYAAMKEVLAVERPRALRLAAVTAISERRPKAAVPVLVDHLQALLKDYKAAVETLVVPEAVIQRPLPKPAAAAPGSPTPPPGYHGPAPVAPHRPPIEARPPPPTPTVTETPLPEQAPTAGQAGMVLRKDLDNMKIEDLTTLTQAVEALPAVLEFHQTGLVLEEVMASVSTEVSVRFGFRETAPWDLDQCAERAVAWRNQHRAEFEYAPPKPPPVAPPAAKPAPAVTAPAPAATAPAPAATTPRR